MATVRLDVQVNAKIRVDLVASEAEIGGFSRYIKGLDVTYTLKYLGNDQYRVEVDLSGRNDSADDVFGAVRAISTKAEALEDD